MAYVYLIQHAKEPRFKIGKSKQPLSRSSAFGEELNLEKSLQIHLGKRSHGLEKGLHALFDSYRLPSISDNDGATEWFRIECWEQCLLFLEQQHDLIGAVPEPIPKPTQLDITPLVGTEKAERRRMNQEAKRRKIHEKNLELIERWEQFLHWLATKQVATEKINKYGSLDIVIQGVPDEEVRAFYHAQTGWSGYVIEDRYWNFGINYIEYCGDSQEFKLTLCQLPIDATKQVRGDIDPELRVRFELMDKWLAERMERVARINCNDKETAF